MERASLTVMLAVLSVLAACGLATPEAATDYGPIGSAVTTTTTAPEAAPERSTTTVMTVAPELLVAPDTTVPEEQPSAAASQPFCLAADAFVFETTQMLLQQDVGAALARANTAIEALDLMTGTAPPQIAGPAATMRAELAAVVADPAAGASVDAFEAAVLAMVDRQGATMDALFATTVEACEMNLTEPNRSSQEGATNIAGL